MSSNNALVISKYKGKFGVFENMCVDNDFELSKDNLLGEFKTLVDAIKYAKKYMSEVIVEYGLSIDDSALEDK